MSLFDNLPDWNNPNYRMYWLKHNLAYQTYDDYTQDDLWRGLAAEGKIVTRAEFREAWHYVKAQPQRTNEFSSLAHDETIPIGLHEKEPYWTMQKNFLYTINMYGEDDDGNTIVTKRAIGSNSQLSPQELMDIADYYFGVQANSEPIEFDHIEITHAYRR